MWDRWKSFSNLAQYFFKTERDRTFLHYEYRKATDVCDRLSIPDTRIVKIKVHECIHWNQNLIR